MPMPGGDKIGRRRLDTHFQGFIELGADFSYDKDENFYSLQGKALHGKFIHLEEPSVTGTANIIMAAVLAEGLPLCTMPLANLIFSNCVICSTEWAQKYLELLLTD
jgi:UDP-N-acetylglucosamine enolpyruvyl transferase